MYLGKLLVFIKGKILASISIITINKYYRLSDQELELEANKYRIGNYADGRGVDRERIIDQLIKKDSANDSRLGLLFSIVSVIVAFSSLGISYLSMVKVNDQNNIVRNQQLPQLVISTATETTEGEYKDSILLVNNYGAAIHNLDIITTTLISADDPKIKFSKENIILDGYLSSSYIQNNKGTLLQIIRGIPGNNAIFFKLSKNFNNEFGSFLSLRILIRASYYDAFGEKHEDFFKMSGFEAEKITKQTYSTIFVGSEVADNVAHIPLSETTEKLKALMTK